MVLSNDTDFDIFFNKELNGDEKTLKIGMVLSQHNPSTKSDKINSENEKSESNGKENMSDNNTSNEELNDDSDEEDSDDEDSEDSENSDEEDSDEDSDDEKSDDDSDDDDLEEEDSEDEENSNSEQYDKLGKSFSDFCRTNKRKDIRNMQKMIDNYDLKLCEAINIYLKSKKQMCLLKEKRDSMNFDLEKVRNEKYKKDVAMFNYMLNHYKNLIFYSFEEIPNETIEDFSKILGVN